MEKMFLMQRLNQTIALRRGLQEGSRPKVYYRVIQPQAT